MGPLGISVSASIRVGNKLGGGNWKLAKFSAYMSLGITLVTSTLTALAIFTLSGVIGKIFSNDPAVQSLITSLAPFVAAYQIFDGVQAVAGGILRGMGRQALGAIVNSIGYYAIALPIACVLALIPFRNNLTWAAISIWLSMLVGLGFVSVVFFFVILVRTDWKHQAELSKKRIEAEQKASQKTQASDNHQELTDVGSVELQVEQQMEQPKEIHNETQEEQKEALVEGRQEV